MTGQFRSAKPLPHRSLAGAREARDHYRWLRQVRRGVRGRLANPLLRQLVIVDIDLQPRGNCYWAPGTRRTAVVSLVPRLSGYATFQQLPDGERARYVDALARLCAVDTVVVHPARPWQPLLSDWLMIGGGLVGWAGALAFLSTSIGGAGLAALLGAALTTVGQTLAPSVQDEEWD